MSNYYAPCFYRIDFVVIPSYIELPWNNKLKINVKCSPICNEEIVKLLGATVNNKISFETHVTLVCKGVSQKLHALAEVSKFIAKKKA